MSENTNMNEKLHETIELTVLCKVVDNYGDIGVVWRMCKNLLKSDVKINLVVDDLISFNKINNTVDISKNKQNINGITVYYWNDYDLCFSDFYKNDGEKLSIILECFQCGRPDWMEKILFDLKLDRIVNIIMIDYLTAEKYAEDFHCLKSLTRSAKVQKVNFMPGFTDRTGGLIIDENWKNIPERKKNGKILVFTYERNWDALIRAIDLYGEKLNHNNLQTEIYLGQGRGFNSLEKSFMNVNPKNVKFKPLNYINQDDWDSLMKECSILFIRGEESMSRACLSGIPFVWHAYPQSDEYQLVKVNALLERMREYFTESEFEIVKNVWLDFNLNEDIVDEVKFQNDIYNFLNMADDLSNGFHKFAEGLQKNGDLCSNLMTFIRKLCIIK